MSKTTLYISGTDSWANLSAEELQLIKNGLMYLIMHDLPDEDEKKKAAELLKKLE